jgi:hypothetical protein
MQFFMVQILIELCDISVKLAYHFPGIGQSIIINVVAVIIAILLILGAIYYYIVVDDNITIGTMVIDFFSVYLW